MYQWLIDFGSQAAICEFGTQCNQVGTFSSCLVSFGFGSVQKCYYIPIQKLRIEIPVVRVRSTQQYHSRICRFCDIRDDKYSSLIPYSDSITQTIPGIL